MRDLRKLLKQMDAAFAGEKSEQARLQKLMLAEMMLRLRYNQKKLFGLFVIFGWQDKWSNKYADIPDAEQDIFARHKINAFRFNDKSFKKILSTVNFDGAILIDPDGNILHSGIAIEGLHPRKLANRLTPNRPDLDLSTKLGFKKKVHTRHLAAIAASYELKGTTVFTVSEESGDVHIFEKGRIVFSTIPQEHV